MIPRLTLREQVNLSGRGLFTGVPCQLRIQPARAPMGLRLRVPGGVIDAVIGALAPAPPAAMAARSTSLQAGDARALTVEHVLSALAGLGVTDAEIHLSSPEVPILDGSAAPFVSAISAVGVAPLPGAIEPIVPARPVSAERDGASITALPRAEPGWSIRYELDYGPGAPIEPQSASWDGHAASYALEIAPARTFCTDREAQAMRDAGLFESLSPRDMLVIGPAGPIDNALRFGNEPARHKLLDVVGDLALAGRPIQADIVARRSGHALNHELARRLADA